MLILPLRGRSCDPSGTRAQPWLGRQTGGPRRRRGAVCTLQACSITRPPTQHQHAPQVHTSPLRRTQIKIHHRPQRTTFANTPRPGIRSDRYASAVAAALERTQRTHRIHIHTRDCGARPLFSTPSRQGTTAARTHRKSGRSRSGERTRWRRAGDAADKSRRRGLASVHAAHARPVVSLRPSAMLRFCTAAPLAPLPRLSRRAATTQVSRSSLQ